MSGGGPPAGAAYGRCFLSQPLHIMPGFLGGLIAQMAAGTLAGATAAAAADARVYMSPPPPAGQEPNAWGASAPASPGEASASASFRSNGPAPSSSKGASASASFFSVDVFTGGTPGVDPAGRTIAMPCYRIPSIVHVTGTQTLVAFAESRPDVE